MLDCMHNNYVPGFEKNLAIFYKYLEILLLVNFVENKKAPYMLFITVVLYLFWVYPWANSWMNCLPLLIYTPNQHHKCLAIQYSYVVVRSVGAIIFSSTYHIMQIARSEKLLWLQRLIKIHGKTSVLVPFM